MFFKKPFQPFFQAIAVSRSTKSFIDSVKQAGSSRKALSFFGVRLSLGFVAVGVITLYAHAGMIYKGRLHPEASLFPAVQGYAFVSAGNGLRHPNAQSLSYLNQTSPSGQAATEQPKARPAVSDEAEPKAVMAMGVEEEESVTEEEEEAALLSALQSKTKPVIAASRHRSQLVSSSSKPNRGFSPLLGKNSRLLMVPLQYARISSRFGLRGGRPHTGMDFAAALGTPIYASAAGEVVNSGWTGGYGNMIMLDHGNGLRTLYGHCSELLVKVGEHVKKGEMIGKVGNTGHSTGPHLHYEVLTNGSPNNPEHFLFR